MGSWVVALAMAVLAAAMAQGVDMDGQVSFFSRFVFLCTFWRSLHDQS